MEVDVLNIIPAALMLILWILRHFIVIFKARFSKTEMGRRNEISAIVRNFELRKFSASFIQSFTDKKISRSLQENTYSKTESKIPCSNASSKPFYYTIYTGRQPSGDSS
jgi:hypothetical protein